MDATPFSLATGNQPTGNSSDCSIRQSGWIVEHFGGHVNPGEKPDAALSAALKGIYGLLIALKKYADNLQSSPGNVRSFQRGASNESGII